MPKRLTTEEFIAKAKKVHGDEYDYSSALYINSHTKIKIGCPTHGEFEATPNNHLTGYKCNKCSTAIGSAKQRKTVEQFILDAKAVHGDRYDYSLADYKTDNEKVELLCSVHGSFWIRPTNHLHAEQGCRSCNMPKSRKCVKWLDSLNVPEQYREARLTINGTTIIADAFDPETSTVYEYWATIGMVIHPSTIKQLLIRMLIKHSVNCINALKSRELSFPRSMLSLSLGRQL